jgi:hypothetical protein
MVAYNVERLFNKSQENNHYEIGLNLRFSFLAFVEEWMSPTYNQHTELGEFPMFERNVKYSDCK